MVMQPTTTWSHISKPSFQVLDSDTLGYIMQLVVHTGMVQVVIIKL